MRQSAKDWWQEWWATAAPPRQALKLQGKHVAKALLEGVHLPPLGGRLAELRMPQAQAARYQALVDECCALLPVQRPAIAQVIARLGKLLRELPVVRQAH